MATLTVDYKVEMWVRAKITHDKNETLALLKKGLIPTDILNTTDAQIEFEELLETETYISPEENDNQATIEVYEGGKGNLKLIWDNSIKAQYTEKDLERAFIAGGKNALNVIGTDGFDDFKNKLNNEQNITRC